MELIKQSKLEINEVHGDIQNLKEKDSNISYLPVNCLKNKQGGSSEYRIPLVKEDNTKEETLLVVSFLEFDKESNAAYFDLGFQRR